MKRTAFTMIELIFVIVILGILSAIAIPRLGSSVDDANIAKGRSDVAAIRAGIVSERQGRLLKGETLYITNLEDSGEALFSNVMQYGIIDKDANGHWTKSDTQYIFKVMETDVSFDYNTTTGRFDCDHDDANCKLLTE